MNHSTLELDEYCTPLENNECTDNGFEIVNASGILATFRRDGLRRQEWYSPQISLNLADAAATANSEDTILVIDNPVFAIYPGKLWKPIASWDSLRRTREVGQVVGFHKRADCAYRFLGGPQKWGNCSTSIWTGENDLTYVRRVHKWRGNDTLITGDGFVLASVSVVQSFF